MTQNNFNAGALNSIRLSDFDNGFQAAKSFWEECKNQIANDEIQKRELDSLKEAYQKQAALLGDELFKFQELLRQVPIVVAVAHWAKGIATDPFWRERYLPKMRKLIQRRIIPEKNPQGQYVTLEFFMQTGHQEILENIRCAKEWSIFEREEIVQCYVQFSHSLARQTFGLIPHGFDPDRDRVRQKVIKYDFFIDFVQHLSERDALIAKLLYFGAQSLEEILCLRSSQLDKQTHSIHFEKGVFVFPWHLVEDLDAFAAAKGEKHSNEDKSQVFTNVRGEEVERAHLNQSFARACQKMSKKVKITPGNLLRLENESGKISEEEEARIL